MQSKSKCLIFYSLTMLRFAVVRDCRKILACMQFVAVCALVEKCNVNSCAMAKCVKYYAG